MTPLLLAILLAVSPATAAEAPPGGPTTPGLPAGDLSPRTAPSLADGPLIDPAPLGSLWLRGERAMAEGRPDEALALFQEALIIEPDNGRTWNYLGGALFARGEYALALRRFLRATELSPRDPKIRNNLASVYDRLGRHAEAIENYLVAIDLDPAYPVPYRNLGAVYAYKVRDPALARRYWTTYLRLDPASPDATGVREELARLPQ